MQKKIYKGKDYNKIKSKILFEIEKNNLHFFDEAAMYSGIARGKFYADKFNKDEDIIDALDKNKVDTKLKLRKKWYDNDNATTQIALYKLIGTNEECEKLTNSNHNIRLDQDGINNQFEKLAEIMAEIHKQESDRPDNTGTV